MNGAGVLAVAANQDQNGSQFLLMRIGLQRIHRKSKTRDIYCRSLSNCEEHALIFEFLLSLSVDSELSKRYAPVVL